MGGVLSQQPQQSLQTPPISSQPKAEGFLAKHQTYLSYFIPMSTPTLTHTHTRPSGPASINAVISILTSKGLPPELVQRIMEDARYWSKCVRSNKKACTIVAGMEPPRQQRGGQLERWVSGQEEEMMGEMTMTNSGLKDDRGKVWYLCSGPIGCSPTRPKVLEEKAIRLDEGEAEERADQVWLRQVVVETSSKDQGWTDHMQYYGTYDHSYSWFELSLIRNGVEVPRSRTKIQHNVHAGQYFQWHCNSLRADHNFVRLAKEGDRVVLWARAEFPGWRNIVQEATITLFTSTYPYR